MTPIYLDYNGSAPVDPQVATAMAATLADGVGNASAAHSFGLRQAAAVDQARASVAHLVGGTANNVVFTAGATEANNLVLQSVMSTAAEGRTRLLISAVEHASVAQCARWLSEHSRAKVEVIPATPGGCVDLDAFADLIGPDVQLVSVMGANSETGVLNDLSAIADMTRDAGALLHSDVTQLVGRGPFDLSGSGVDAATISSHKICGPGGVGALISTRQTKRQLQPIIHGGGQEGGLRSGSLNVAGIVGFGVAAQLAAQYRETEAQRTAKLRDRLVAGLVAGLDNVHQNGDVTNRLPNTANLRFAGADAQAVVVNADPVAVSAGSACASGTIEPSPVLIAMGIDREAASESLRFSLGRFTTATEIEQAIPRIIEAVQYVRTMTASN